MRDVRRLSSFVPWQVGAGFTFFLTYFALAVLFQTAGRVWGAAAVSRFAPVNVYIESGKLSSASHVGGGKKRKNPQNQQAQKKTCSKLQTEHPRDCGRLVWGGRAGHASPLGGSSRPPGGMRGYGDIGIQGYGDAGIWGRGVRGPLAGAAAGDESAFRASP